MKKLTFIAAALALTTSSVVFADGAATYNTRCSVCHATGIAGAPKFGDKAAWAPRIATGMDAMLTVAKNGKGGMPPRGTCGDCSDADLQDAIQHMIDNAK